MNTVLIPLTTAQYLAIRAQLLAETLNAHKPVDIINKLGYVQIDTIHVISRAHHHTLWNRYNDYQEKELDALYQERNIFEYWGHAMSLLPMQDYRFYLPRMREFQDPASKWFKNRLEKFGEYMQPVLERIRNEDLPVIRLKSKNNLVHGHRILRG